MSDDPPETFDEARLRGATAAPLPEWEPLLLAEREHRAGGPNTALYVEMDGLPDVAWNAIAPNLWIGGMARLGPADPASLEDFESGWTYDERPLRADGPFADDQRWIHHDTLDLPGEPADVVRIGLDLWRSAADGRRTLSRCWAGLNRSSLFAGTGLVLAGADPEAVVARIRERRHHGALNNPAYVDFLVALGAQVRDEWGGSHPDATPGVVDPAEGLR